MVKKKAGRVCLNCGGRLRGGDFCPQCGQSAATERLRLRPFLRDVFAGLFRVNRGFFYTCGCLLARPWAVIADYIHGKRVRYTGPVQLLLVLCFISVIVHHLLGRSDVVEFEFLPEDIAGHHPRSAALLYLRTFLEFYLSTPVLQYVVVFIPALPVLRFVFRHYGAGRFNSAEYLLAALYMSGTYLAAEILCSPLDLIHEGAGSWLPGPYLCAVGALGVYHAFLSRGVPVLRAVRLIAVYFLTALATYVLLLTTLAVAVGLIAFR